MSRSPGGPEIQRLDGRDRVRRCRRLVVGGLPIAVREATEVVERANHSGKSRYREKENSIRVCFEAVKIGLGAESTLTLVERMRTVPLGQWVATTRSV